MADGYVDPLADADARRDVLGYHPATEHTAARHSRLRDAAIEFSDTLYDAAPQSPERTLAFRHIQQAMMFGNAAIAIHSGAPLADDPDTVHPTHGQ